MHRDGIPIQLLSYLGGTRSPVELFEPLGEVLDAQVGPARVV